MAGQLVIGTAAAWPPAFDGVSDTPPAAASAAGDPAPAGAYPPAGWPSVEQLQYTKEAITVTLLVLALPWLVFKLMTNPGYVLAGAGRQHIRRGG